MAKTFRLLYSPSFYLDLDQITDYIALELKNESAAKTLINKTEIALKQRLSDPLAPEIYPSMKQRKYPYRRIIVGNYLIFYVVIDDVMEIRRILYGRRELRKFL